MQWIQDNWVDIAAIFLALHGLAVVVVNMTPTPKDDAWVGRAYRWFEIIGGIVTSRAKEKKE